jgi:eukaryotic-like serine/threonine-protein kinase
MQDDLARIEEIFGEALSQVDAAARAAYLDQACGADAVLRARVEALLAAHEATANLFRLPDGDPAAENSTAVNEGPGSRIGRYKLLEQIGEGGFGVVFMAEQTEPVQRKVALKIIKPGMDSRQVIARFEAERQALAVMDHPHIAKVLDAGTTDTGRPYFVMELVKGLPIVQYCDEHRLSPRQRLELFVSVCQAVQHAHQKGIIHRDLKPTNVLVAEYDEQPAAMVIDFGVAKAVGRPLTEKTLFTEFGQVVGTIDYMSPEQAKLNQLDIDTRTDIYSLGVLLYELLTGSTPLDRKRLHSAAFDEMLRIIREDEPPNPSTRLSSSDALPSIAANRSLEPKKLTGLVRGELDWIVMKALEKDRNRRYETANDLAVDVQRYLADESVQACPPSATYRLKKFVRRNKGPVVAAAVVLLTLVGGIVGTAFGLVRAEQARRAEAERTEGERLAKERAEANFALAGEAVEKFLVTVTDDPELNQADFNRLRKKLLESAIPFFQKIAAEKSDNPVVEAARGRAYLRLALLRMSLGEDEAALQDTESTRTVFARLNNEFPLESAYRHGLANGLHNRAILLAGLAKRAEAEADYRQAIEIMEKLVADSPYESARRDLAEGYHDLSHLLFALGKHDEAEMTLQRALDVREKLVAEYPRNPENRQKLAQSQSMMGSYLAGLGEYAKAKVALARALEVQEKLVADFPEELKYSANLALQLAELGILYEHPFEEFDAAEVNFRKALSIQDKLAAAFPTVPSRKSALANIYENLGVALAGQRKFSDAEAAFRAALGIREKLVAAFPNIPGYQSLLAGTYNSLGNVLVEMGKDEDGKAAYRTALEINERIAASAPGIQGYQVALGGAYCNFGILLLESGQPVPAFEWLQKAVGRLEGVLTQEPRLTAAREFLRNSHMARADALIALGRRAEALESREQEVSLNASLLGPNHVGTLTSMYLLVQEYEAVGRSEDARQLRKELLTRRGQTLSPDDPDTLAAMDNMAKKTPKLREEVLADLTAKIPNYRSRLTTMSNLAGTYALLGRQNEALVLREELLGLRTAKLGPDAPQTLSSMHELVESLINCDRGAEAMPIIDKCVRCAAGQAVDPNLIASLCDLRLIHFKKSHDASGCQTTAEMWEDLNRTDADDLYRAARYRAATAAVLRATDKSDKGKRSVAADADRAIDWLTKAVAAGYSDVARIEKDEDLDILRDRAEFQQLLARAKAQPAAKARVSGGGER